MSAEAATRIDVIDWRHAHEELVRISRCRGELDYDEGRWLLAALRSGAHVHLGYASFLEYIERLFGYGPRFCGERLRVAEALEDLPESSQALRDGVLTWSVVREITRVATPQTEGQWVETARSKTVRQVEQLVSGRTKGDGPEDPAQARPQRHVLRLELSAEAMATYREAVGKLRRQASGPLDEDAALLMMARCVLGGPTDEGRSSYQIAMTVCGECKKGWQQGKGELIEVDAEAVEMAECDAQRLPPTGGASRARAKQDVPPATRREVMRRDGGQCVVNGCRSSVFLDIHHTVPRNEGGTHDPDLMACLCEISAHHRAVHRGQLTIEGRHSTGFIFRHADGTAYGATVCPETAQVMSDAFSALRGLGFAETESRRALDFVRTHVGRDASLDDVLRQALRALRGPTPERRPVSLVESEAVMDSG
ncbi:hypothetical protein H8E07_02680 [bacterium]|nr:hypothetical protein [bacterium]